MKQRERFSVSLDRVDGHRLPGHPVKGMLRC
jgi:hypothetical protein